MIAQTPTALTIAGSDPSGGAGIQADLKTFTALGAYGASVIVALTAQNTQGVTGIHAVPGDFIAAQLDAVFNDLSVPAAKVGMLGTSEATCVVADTMAKRGQATAFVVDPVMVATSGDVLLAPEAEGALRELILPRARLITPNLPEAARLLDAPLAETEADAVRQAERLKGLGAAAVLVKGGHSLRDTAEAVDILMDDNGLHRFAGPRISTRNTHGTGCTLSAAITVGLVSGASLVDAVARAKQFVTAGLEAGAQLKIGQGRGPLDHIAAGRRMTMNSTS